MARFRDREVTFELPDDWTDQSVVSYSERHAKGLPANISLTRAEVRPDATVALLADETVRRLEGTLTEFKLHERNEVTIENTFPAVQLLVEWRHPRETVTQLVTMFIRDGVCWTLTATAPTAKLDALDHVIQRMLSSLRVAPSRRPAQ